MILFYQQSLKPSLPETSPNEGSEPVVTDIPTIPVSNENDVVNEVDALPEMDIPGPAPLEEPPVSTDSPLSPLPVIPSVPESAEISQDYLVYLLTIQILKNSLHYLVYLKLKVNFLQCLLKIWIPFPGCHLYLVQILIPMLYLPCHLCRSFFPLKFAEVYNLRGIIKLYIALSSSRLFFYISHCQSVT